MFIDPLAELLRQRELWVAFGAALVLGAAVAVASPRHLHVVLIVVVAAMTVDSLVMAVLALAVAFGVGRLADERAATPSALAVSALAVGGTYATTPDTERAIVTLGATGALIVLALVVRAGWSPSAAALTVVLGWIAVTDGRPRWSAVVAVLGIAVVHTAFQRFDRRAPGGLPAATLVVVAAPTIGVLSRVAGMMSGSAGPTALTTSVTAVSIAAGATIVRMSARRPLRQSRPGGRTTGERRRFTASRRRTCDGDVTQ